MGMSATQARLLYITAQLNNLSYQGQVVSDAKVRLSMDTEKIQEEYTEALSNSRYYVNTTVFSSSGSTSKSELISLSNLKSINLLVYDGNTILGYKYEEVDTGETKTVITGYENDYDSPIYPTTIVDGEEVEDTTQEPIGYNQKAITVEIPVMEKVLVEDPDYEEISSNELELGLRSGKYQLVAEATDSSTENMTINGTDYELISISSCTSITEETDEQALAIAEAEYEQQMQAIQAKDDEYELDQKKIDTEYEALTTEEETIKSAIEKNIERSFSAFS